MSAAERLLAIARAELGYREKETNDCLDSPTANAGDENFTKYARDLWEAGYYQASKQGYDWCDMFVDWCFLQLCGSRRLAEQVQCQTGPYGAGCIWSARYYEAQGRLCFGAPVPGDQIFFRDYSHTGLVEQVREGRLYTLEGNAHNQVERRCYRLEDDRILSFGRPLYHLVPQKEETFADVDSRAYYAEAVRWAVERGIVQGVEPGKFAPEQACRRCEAVTMLWRLAGSPDPQGPDPAFADVEPDAYYAKAVRWAVQEHITSGADASRFQPDAVCTRAQIVTFLWRMAGAPRCGGGDFADVTAEDFFADAVTWACGRGITAGMDRDHFGPHAPCTRAMIVTMLKKYSE